MTSKQQPGATLLVPIDYHGVNPASLDVLVRIAGQLNLRLLALILESPRLQRVAELPFTTEVLLGSGTERSLERDHLSRRHSRMAADTRRRLKELAQQASIELSIEDDAGDRWHASLARDGGLDIFIPPRGRWRRSPRGGASRLPAIPRLGLLLSGGELDQKLVSTTLALEEAGLVGSVYVICAGRPDPDLLASLLRGRAHCHLQAGTRVDAVGLTRLIRSTPYELLVIPRDALADIPDHTLDAALEEAGGQVMVVS